MGKRTRKSTKSRKKVERKTKSMPLARLDQSADIRTNIYLYGDQW